MLGRECRVGRVGQGEYGRECRVLYCLGQGV